MNFKLLMISAMYENGGNTTHRFLDGHPQMLVYPFESQLGTRWVSDPLSSVFPVKYRWPAFLLDATPAADYHAIIDEECKVRARTPHVSKFRHAEFKFSDDRRRDLYTRLVTQSGRSRAANVAAFFTATFDAWENCRRSGQESFYVGYSPIVVVDAQLILSELPQSHVLHVVRNPWSAYADTKRRPVPLSLDHYMLGWTLNQYYALVLQNQFPTRLHIVRIEDVMRDSRKELGLLCAKLGLEVTESLDRPSWNGAPLSELAPWGTIRQPTLEANRATAAELNESESSAIRERAWQYLERFDYKRVP